LATPHQNDRHLVRHFSSLDKHRHFEQLVQRPKPTRHEDIGLSRGAQHDFARKKVPESHRFLHVLVASLFHGQANVQAHRFSTRFERTPVRRLHETRPAARDDGVSLLPKLRRQFLRKIIILAAGTGAGAPEHGHLFFQLCQKLKPFHEFRHDAENAPVNVFRKIRRDRRSRRHTFVVDVAQPILQAVRTGARGRARPGRLNRVVLMHGRLELLLGWGRDLLDLLFNGHKTIPAV
jgi:hypothetical protein